MEPVVIGPQSPYQLSDTETYSKNILGPVWFSMSNLRVAGTAGIPPQPVNVAPSQSPYIVAADEEFSVSVDIEFNNTPLSSLLLCLGTKVTVSFGFEGIGAMAAELDLSKMIKTEKGTYKYTITRKAIPAEVGLTPGLYAIAAVATVGPADHECSQCVLGYGYIAKALLQVYQPGGCTL